jgi:hypothetical protein
MFSIDDSKEMKQVYQMIALKTEGHYLIGLEPQIFLDKLTC